jgi:hypothetical protein
LHTYKIAFIVLDTTEIPPEIATMIPILSLKRICELMMDTD